MESDRRGDTITGHVTGDVHGGQVAIGKDIHQNLVQAAAEARTPDDFRRVIAELRAQVEADAPPELAPRAIERIDELADSVEKSEPDISTMEYVKNWFGKNLPKLGGAVTGLIFSPIVGKVVEAAGEVAVAEFRRRFGQPPGGRTPAPA